MVFIVTNVTQSGLGQYSSPGDTFTVEFDLDTGTINPLGERFKSIVDTYWGTPPAENWCNCNWVETRYNLTRHVVIDNCVFCTDPQAPAGTRVPVYLTVQNLDTGELHNPMLITYTWIPEQTQGIPTISVPDLPAQMQVNTEYEIHGGIVANGGAVSNPAAGIRQIDGPAVGILMADNTYHNLPTTSYVGTGSLTGNLLSGNQADFTFYVKFPSGSVGNKITIELAGGKWANDTLNNTGNRVQKITYLKAAPTCTAGSEPRCVGCERQVCTDGEWQVQNPNDPTCPGCSVGDKTCDGKPANTVECGHPAPCNKYKCNGLTGNWDVQTTGDVSCDPVACAPAVCTNGQFSCDPAVTKGDKCTKYACIGGHWQKQDTGIGDCGAVCAVQNPLIYGSVAAIAISGALAYYYFSTKSPKKQP